MLKTSKHPRLLLLTGILLGFGMSFLVNVVRVETAENGVWIEGTDISYEKWSRFAVCHFHEKEASFYLIRQDFEVGVWGGEGFNPQRVKLSAFPLNVLSLGIGKKPVWQLETVGVDGHYYGNDFYGVEAPGCCDARDTTLYYSLRTGKFAGASTSRPLEIGVPNTTFWRFLTTQSRGASQWKGIEAAHISVFYASKEGLMQSVGIILPEKLAEAIRDYQWSFSGKDKADTRNDLFGAKTIAGAAVVLESSLVTPFSITLPFGDDGFDISKASMEGVEAKLLTETYPDAAPDKNEETKQDNH